MRLLCSVISSYSRMDGSKCGKGRSNASSGRGTTHFCAPFGWCQQSRHGGPCGGRSSRPDFGITSRTLKKRAISLHSRSLRELKSDGAVHLTRRCSQPPPGAYYLSHEFHSLTSTIARPRWPWLILFSLDLPIPNLFL